MKHYNVIVSDIDKREYLRRCREKHAEGYECIGPFKIIHPTATIKNVKTNQFERENWNPKYTTVFRKVEA